MKKVYLPGDFICESDGYIKGHGTELVNGAITAKCLGTVQQIDKLITAIPVFNIRYTPEMGDVVIGRVTQIFNKRWRLDTNSKNETTLSLGAINLPGVAQRRKSEEDEINMHKYFGIGDVVVCEVQKVSKSGNAALHTRNDKYGRLSNGILVCVTPSLLVLTKSKFISKGHVDVIGGCNGFIWIGSRDFSVATLRSIASIRIDILGCRDRNEPIDLEKIVEKNVPAES